MPGFFRGARLSGSAVAPKPTYTGNFSFYSHGIYDCMKLLTSGILTLDRIGPYDVFVVGGGGGSGPRNSTGASGGGGGYTNSLFDYVFSNAREQITVTIGDGGIASNSSDGIANSGKATSFGSYIVADGGQGTQYLSTNSIRAGSGGSGGGGGFSGPEGVANGGSDGADGLGQDLGNAWSKGIGQHTTTRAFADPTEELYSGGGSGARNGAINNRPGTPGGGGAGFGQYPTDDINGKPNTGGGGGGSAISSGRAGGDGGSGIAIIRWRAR